MMIHYPVTIIQDTTHQFFAHVPDLPNVTASGDSIAEVLSCVRVAIIDHLQQLANHTDTLPHPNNINTHLSNPRYAGSTWAIVSFDASILVNQTPPITLTLPRHLLQKLSQKLNIDPNDASQTTLKTYIIELLQQSLKDM